VPNVVPVVPEVVVSPALVTDSLSYCATVDPNVVGYVAVESLVTPKVVADASVPPPDPLAESGPR
jgi:hypothetical protein